MRLAIIADDNVVIVNGKGHKVDCSSLTDIHAVQWYDDHGEIEWKPGAMSPRTAITDISLYQPLIDAWTKAEQTPPPLRFTPPEVQARIDIFAGDTDRQDLIDRMRNATPDEIKRYITTNVTDLASARVMLIKLALIIAPNT